MVDAYLVSNLQESLGLTDEQFAKAIPLVKKVQAERREYLHRADAYRARDAPAAPAGRGDRGPGPGAPEAAQRARRRRAGADPGGTSRPSTPC
jgi:hypothetical protein